MQFSWFWSFCLSFVFLFSFLPKVGKFLQSGKRGGVEDF